MYLYHRVPDGMEGTILYPLNQLKELMPEVCARQAAKYAGREFIMERKIGILNCAWNDVLHLSPIHPSQISAAFSRIGLVYKPSDFFEVSAESLDPKETVIQPMYDSDSNETVSYNIEKLKGMTDLPAVTETYYRERFLEGKRPLHYVSTPHILFRGTIETKSLKKISVF